jgi:hypothetical protein
LSHVRDEKIAFPPSGFSIGLFGISSRFVRDGFGISRRDLEEINKQTIRTGEDKSAGGGENKSLVGYYQTTKSSSKTVHICAVIREFPAEGEPRLR